MADTSITTQSNNGIAATTPTALGEITGGAEITAHNNLTLLQVLLIRYRKLLMFVAAGLMFMGFVGLMLWSGATPYRTLYSGLGEKDAAAMVEFLQKEHIPYKLQGADTITVPADKVYSARLKLASNDLQPKSGTGYEIFDKKNEFGMSDFTQKINLQRALQGELARTLEVIPQVASARVQLVMSKESAFAERDRKASASVMLQLNGAGKLPKATVEAVQNLVAASVPDLAVGDVTVVDSSGNLLSSTGKDEPNSQGETMQQYQISLEARLEHRVTSMLEQVVGAGQAVVRVSADIDRQFVDQNNISYNPDEQVVRSQHTITEDHSSMDTAPMGVPGLASNTPGNNPAVTSKGSGASSASKVPNDQAKRNENTTNYEISSVTEHRIIPFGAVTKLSVAVVVGGTSKTDAKGNTTFTPVAAAQLSKLRGLVDSAIGFNEDRGDSVTIQSMPIHDISSRGEVADVNASLHGKAFYMDLARYGLAALALILMAWFLLRPLAQRLAGDPSVTQEEEEEEDPFANLSEEAYARLAMVEKARIAVKHDPERAAKVITEWAGSAASV
ncbi:MAG: flagellar basal-body MS-ring/collar protein FliF [Mariprofundales bacterium]|nr:flagellar basal-body MS-ring/collar protein FliF [Mariprofundales bacterium]